MARLQQDSEDDLPELTDVLDRHVANLLDRGGDSRRTKRVPPAKVERISRAAKEAPRKQSGSIQDIDDEELIPKAKKRVLLIQRKGNPLLEPLQSPRKVKPSLLRSSEPKSSDTFENPPSMVEKAPKPPIKTSEGPKPRAKKAIMAQKPDEDDSSDESDNLSDFVFNDSSFLDEDEDSPVEKLPLQPKPTRRLVRGRKPRTIGSFEEQIDNDDEPSHLAKHVTKARSSAPVEEHGASDLEESIAILSFSPSENKSLKVCKSTRFTTPPQSPSKLKPGLVSPSKRLNRIPLTPHRPSLDAFWSQDVVNEWNDEFSPKKALKSSAIVKLNSSDEPDHISKSAKKSPTKNGKAIAVSKKEFSGRKHELAVSFLQELDQTITAGQVSKMAESTGGVSIVWSKTLQTTAGRANWRREGIRSLPLGASTSPTKPAVRHFASIELAEKVIDDEDRLLNVIAHEFCHLANFMVSGIKTNPHGKEFQAWGAKCSQAFGHRGVEVTTKHSYAIDYKYVWTCTSCSREFKRHSRSIDPARHTCGACKSKLVQTKPVPRASGNQAAPNEYQMFVKEHMKIVRQENPGSPQKEIMGLVGKKYQLYKASKLGGDKTVEQVRVTELEQSREISVDEVDDVARKLNFMDLTSP